MLKVIVFFLAAAGLLVSLPIAALSLPQASKSEDNASSMKVSKNAPPSFSLSSYDWQGELPKSLRVIVNNPLGSISSRSHSEQKIILHATIQTIGDHKLEPSFIIAEEKGETLIQVTYPESIRNEKRELKGRVDIAILFPETISLIAQTDFGMIKVDKSLSPVAAFTRSGEIKLSTSGLFYAETDSGNITLALRGFVDKGPVKAISQSGNIKASIFDDMDIDLSAATRNKILFNDTLVKEKSFHYQNKENISLVELSSQSGEIEITIEPPPELIQSVRPASKDVDLRRLPQTKQWKPGDPVIERDDRRNNRK